MAFESTDPSLSPSGGAATGGGETGGGGGFNVGVFGTVISGLSSAYSSYVSGQMAADSMTFNAKIKEIQGRMLKHTAKLNADRTRERGVSYVKMQQAKYSKAGVRSEGSPVDVMIDSMANFEYDARITELNAEMGIASKQMEGASLQSKAQFYKEQGIRAAGGTLMDTTMDVVATYYNPKGND